MHVMAAIILEHFINIMWPSGGWRVNASRGHGSRPTWNHSNNPSLHEPGPQRKRGWLVLNGDLNEYAVRRTRRTSAAGYAPDYACDQHQQRQDHDQHEVYYAELAG